MKQAIKAMGHGNYQSSARGVDGTLILSFPHALTPVVWQMDLSQTKASALEVQEQKDKNQFILVLKTARGEATDVAPFEKRQQAIDALMAVSHALENAQGQMRAGSEGGEVIYRAAVEAKPRKSWAGIGLALLLLIVLLMTWSAMAPRPPQGQAGAASSIDQSAAPPADANGSPVNADDFLNKNK